MISRIQSDLVIPTPRLYVGGGGIPFSWYHVFMGMKFVYILASESGTLYVGMTNNISRRMYEHKHHLVPGFTDTYDCTKLVYYEQHLTPLSAIEREKQLKNWRREKKENIIRTMNLGWTDLSTTL